VTIAFKAVCEVAFNTLGMECLAIEDITLTVFQVRGIVALVAFTDLAINTVTKTTSLRTMRYIALGAIGKPFTQGGSLIGFEQSAPSHP
jgi:hypothetical protein